MSEGNNDKPNNNVGPKLPIYVQLSHEMHQSPSHNAPTFTDIKPVKADSRTAHIAEIDKLTAFLRRTLPTLSEEKLNHFGEFLIQAPMPENYDTNHQKVIALNHRSTIARSIAGDLVNAGFGQPKRNTPEKPIIGAHTAAAMDSDSYRNNVLSLAALLMEAPPSNAEKIAAKTLRLDFKNWRGKFAKSLQAQERGTREY